MAGLTDLAMRILIGAEDRTGPAVKTARQGVQSISDSLARVETLAKRVLDIRLFAGWAQDGIKLSDTYKGLTGRIQQAVGETGNLAAQQGQLFNIAQRTFAPLEDTVKLYSRANASLENFANGQQLAAKLTETVNLSFKAQASSAAEVASTVTQLTQAIATDAVQWNDFGQLADTNLMLVNVAAKNLGYDGIGALKQAMSEGAVSNTDLVNAIVAGFDEIKAAADKMPVTVEAAWTQVRNSLLKYVGDSDAAGFATQRLASGLQALANNVGPLANAGILLAEVYGARVVAGMLQSGKAYIQNTLAARQAAQAAALETAAQRQNMLVKAQAAAIQAKAALSLIEEARLQRSLAVTEQQRTQAVNALTAAIQRYKTAAAGAAAANAALSAGTAGGAAQADKLEKAFNGVNHAINGFLAFEIGQTVGEWASQFEPVRLVGVRIAEAFTIALTGVQGFFSGISFKDRWEQVKQIHAEYNQIAAGSTATAQQSQQQIAQAEQQKAQSVEQSELKQQQSFEATEKAVKALTANIDDSFKQQNAAIERALTERLAQIDARSASEALKDSQRIQAKLESATQELDLVRTTGQAKLDLLDQLYTEELANDKLTAQRKADIERQSLEARKSIYNGLADHYAGVVNRLTAEHGREVQAAFTANQSLQQLAANHEAQLSDIARLGMTERQKLASQESEFDSALRAAKAEQAKGEAADQDKINELLNRAKQLNNEITNAAVNKAKTQTEKNLAVYDAQDRVNELYKIEKTAIETNRQAHENNAAAIEQSLDKAKTALENTSATIDDITAKLNQSYALEIGIDQTSLDSARATLADLTKPETKTITIVTQNAGSAGETGGVPAQATGGLAGVPTIKPWQFATGGYAPKSGKLPGFGGGDKIRALLEAGEFIVRKEAVQKLGVRFMERINAGHIPIKRASGGIVDYTQSDALSIQADEERLRLLAEQEKRLKKLEQKRGVLKEWQAILTDQSGLLSLGKDLAEIKKKLGFAKTRKERDELWDEYLTLRAEKQDAEDNLLVRRNRFNLDELARKRQTLEDSLKAKAASINETEVTGKIGSAQLTSGDTAMLPDLIEQFKRLALERKQAQIQFSGASKTLASSLYSGVRNPQTRSRLAAEEKIKRIDDLIQKLINKIGETGHIAKFVIGINRVGLSGAASGVNALASIDGAPLNFNTGGLVPGSGNGDTVPAMLTPGEFIMKKTAVRAFGPDFMRMLNNGMAPVRQFANGGLVGGSANAGETITLNLNLNGKSAAGVFQKTAGTKALLDELKREGLASA